MAFSVCDRVQVMYAGRSVEVGGAGGVSERPLHPYTLGLLLSEPGIEEVSNPDLLMRGSVPRASEVAEVCAFAARCSWAEDGCVVARPPLVEVEPGRISACIRIGEIEREMAALRREQAADRGEAVAGRAPSEAIVTVRDLTKTFRQPGGREEDVTIALGGVSLEIGAGECVGLVGESGSGKTTLARCLVGLASPSSGTMEIDGIDATDPSRLNREDLRRLRNSIQYVFQDPYSSLNPTKTVAATLTEAVALRRGNDKAVLAARVDELLGLVGLPTHYKGRKPVALSGGERQRVAIARALALEPRIVICDEPVSSLDVSVQAQVLELLNEIRQETGVSYLFITHDLAVVRQVADRIYVLYRGELVEQGPAVELLSNPGHEYTRTLVAAAPGHWDRDSGLAQAPPSTMSQ
jgi:peptide/nickel transport system ATP-binding protein